MPPIELIGESEYWKLLETPYNPAPDFTDDFVEEHEQPHIQMKQALFAIGGGVSDGPFNYEAFGAMEDCWTTSRLVQATLESETFIRTDLLSQLYSIVAAFKFDYAMNIDTAWSFPVEFALYITRTKISAYLPDVGVLPLIYGSNAD